MEEEGLQKTDNEMISIGKPLDIDEKNLFDKINQLYVEAYNETDRMKELVHELVPTYKIDQRTINRSESKQTKKSTTKKSSTSKKKPAGQSGAKIKKPSTAKSQTKTVKSEIE